MRQRRAKAWLLDTEGGQNHTCESRSGQRSHSLITGILLPPELDRKVGQLNPGSIERGLEMKVFHYHLQIGRKELCLVSIRVYQCSASQLNTVDKGKKREGFSGNSYPPCPLSICPPSCSISPARSCYGHMSLCISAVITL